MNSKKLALILSIVLIVSLIGFFISININDDISNFREYNEAIFSNGTKFLDSNFILNTFVEGNLYPDGPNRNEDALASLLLDENYIEELDYKSIHIGSNASNIVLRYSLDDSTKIFYNTKQIGRDEDLYLDIFNDDGYLRISERSNRRRTSFFSNGSYGEIVLEIPKDKLESANINTSSGDIKIEELESDDIWIDATSGYINAKLVAKSANISSSSGDIEIPSVQSDSLVLSTTSGYISGSANVSAGLSIETSSGDVKLLNSKATAVSAKSTSGYIQLDVNCEMIKIGTSSGDVKLKGNYNKVDIETSSGDVDVQSIPSARIEVDTSSGYIRTDHTTSEKHLYTGDDASEQRIIINTSSGDVNIYEQFL